MYKDYTIKAKISSGKELENKLSQLNSNFLGVDIQTDTYFEVETGKLKLREGTIENLITHYERTRDGDAEKTNVFRYDLNPSKEEIEKLKLGLYDLISNVIFFEEDGSDGQHFHFRISLEKTASFKNLIPHLQES